MPALDSGTMRRWPVVLVVLLSLLWQSVTLARAGSTVNALADTAHAALHWHDEGHHHHDDGTYQLDDSSEAQQHLLGDHVNTTVALLLVLSHGFPPPGSAPPGTLPLHDVPAPDLEGLLRPPQARA